MLMMNQRGDEHFGREREELRGEDAADHGGKLHEVGHFVQQGLGLRVLMQHRAAPEPARLRLEIPHDPVAPFDAREDHEVFGQPLAELVEAANLDGPARAAAGRQEPMAVRHGARGHILHARARRQRLAAKS